MLKIKKIRPNLIILLIIVALVFFVAGVKIGAIILKNKIADYEATLDYYAPMPDELYTIKGEIVSINENGITLSVISPVDRQMSGKDPIMIEYELTINDDTKITKTEVNINPAKSKTTNLTLGDLKQGNEVSIRSTEDIMHTTKLTATLIDLVIFPEI